jgi:hypothetical protein
MPILIPSPPTLFEVERRRHPAILGEAPSSSQSDAKRDQAFRYQLLATSALSSYHTLEQTYNRLKDELFVLRALNRDWDTYGADPPSEATIRAAQLALPRLKALGALPAAVRPSSEGGVGICFVSREGYGHLEFLNEGEEVYALAYSSTRAPESWQLDGSDASLRQAWEQIRAYLQP